MNYWSRRAKNLNEKKEKYNKEQTKSKINNKNATQTLIPIHVKIYIGFLHF
jgi:hypothetical protein